MASPRNSLKLTTVVIPGAVALVVGALLVLAWSKLPERVVIHWDVAGEPDGYASRSVAVAIFAGLYAAAWASLAWTVRRGLDRERAFGTHYAVLAALAVAATGFVVMNATSLVEDRRALFAMVVAVLGTARLADAVGVRIAPPSDPAAVHIPEQPVLAPGEQGVWFGSATSRWAIAVAVTIAAVLPIWFGWSLGSLAQSVGLVLVVLSFSRVRVWVTPAHVQVAWGPLGIVRPRYRLEQVELAAVETVNPFGYGGWGYRRRPDAAAFVVRGGEALRLERSDGTAVVVTVDDAEQAAQLVNDLVARRRATPNPA